MDDRHYASLVLPDIDYESQLNVIRSLLSSHKRKENIVARNIQNITYLLKDSKPDRYYDHLSDKRVDMIHGHMYQGAAHSMAAVGMLAPFLESLFHQTFHGIHNTFLSEKQSLQHNRFKESDNKVWDCHFVWSTTQQKWIGNLEEGIEQLSDYLGLKLFLPRDLKSTLNVLFSYRNKMFHCGFEWPLEEREKFHNRIKNGELPEKWFKYATSGEVPIIFYLNDAFIEHCLQMSDTIIEQIGKYVKRKIEEINILE